MSKRDDDDGYTLGDLLAGMLIGATAAAIGVAAMTLRSPRGRDLDPDPAPARPAPPFEVEEHAGAADVAREGAGIN